MNADLVQNTNTKKRLSIAQIMAVVLNEEGMHTVMYGDRVNLDKCANLASHTNLGSLHPLVRHKRILDALENSKLFSKMYVRCNDGRRERLVRGFKLVLGPEKETKDSYPARCKN
jgi:hypothetical protein